ncbi:MAG: hypothetical protein LBF15_03290 [Candidatus Peribacteria bacterium]|jgi:hypothetical protein|nr:hypothetical protein [Candidatus Peribacteria bacterium]
MSKILDVRKTFELINWNCEKKFLLREKNLGCTNAVSGAITWFFDNEEY